MPDYRINLMGVIASSEEFQHGVTVTSVETLTQVADDALSTAEGTLFSSDFLSNFTTGVAWTQINISELGGFGEPVAASQIRPLSETGTAEGAMLPPQCAIVVSHLTLGAGSRNRGRAYLPAPAASGLTTLGRITSTVRGELLTAYAGWLGALDAAGSQPIVRSEVGGGAVSFITSVRVGDVVDTQRRRRGALGESYASMSI